MPAALPPLATQHLPVLQQEVRAHWPTVPFPAMLAAQVEQETCPSLTHRKCWNPRTELKVADPKGGLREYGFGLGQLTVTKKFDNFAGAKTQFKELRGWEWDNRYDAAYQLRTMVLMNRFAYGKLSWAATPEDRMAFTFATYNGGLGGVLSDRSVCKATPGCDPTRWFNEVENTSKKAKVAVHGYGQSFFQINRSYVRNVMCTRVSKYRDVMQDKSIITCKSKQGVQDAQAQTSKGDEVR